MQPVFFSLTANHRLTQPLFTPSKTRPNGEFFQKFNEKYSFIFISDNNPTDDLIPLAVQDKFCSHPQN